MQKDISIDIDLTWTNIIGACIIFVGFVSLFTVKDSGLASTCIVTGAGLCGVAKVANTVYDNNHVEITNERDTNKDIG